MFERRSPEQHDTLPDVPEPAENPFLAGHENAATQLVSAYRAGKLHHAVLLAGPQGIGKATLAFHLTHHLLRFADPTTSPDMLQTPDPQTASARQVAIGSHPSLLYLTRPWDLKRKKFKTEITVDEIRRVNRFLAMTSHDRGNRVVIVDPVDDLNRNAANALLKNLEEPPSKTFFFLVAHAPGRVLKTILSRCLTLRLQPLDREMLLEVLKRLPFDFSGTDEASQALVDLARGSVRRAILLSEFGGMDITAASDRILDVPAFDARKAHEVAAAVSGRDQNIQFEIFNQHLLDRIASQARRVAGAGSTGEAGRLGVVWQETAQTIADTAIYNLDRKQHTIGMLHRLNRAFHAG